MTEHASTEHRPDLPQLSAYMDGELDAGARQYMAAHLAACPQCAARLAELQALSQGLQALPQESLGIDLAGVIEGRLGAAVSAPSGKPRRGSAFGWWPAALGAALSISTGVFLGSALVSAGAVSTPRVAAMQVFDSMPPGSLCIGLSACYVKGQLP